MDERADVVVIGGGPAGVCAAISAARENKSTILISDRPVLGGNSSSEIRVWARGATGAGNLFAEEMGIWGELKLKNLYSNPEGNPVFWDDILLDAVLAEGNLDLFLNTHITGIDEEGGKIACVSGFQMGTEKQLTYYGKVFIDATGDGTIGAIAGIPCKVGKESKDEYGESFAPLQEEKGTFGNTIFYYTVKAPHVVRYKAPEYAYNMKQIETILDKGGRIVNEKMDGCDYWWFETGGMKDTISDAQEIAIDLKCLVSGVWNYIKNSGKFDADYLTLSWQGNLPGKRESRRMITEEVVKQQDIVKRTGFEDAAFYGGWYMDFHPSGGIHTEEDYCLQIPVQVYQLPFRALYSREKENLFFAGRDIGSSHVAFASLRIMNTCALSGQAAGMLASGCIDQGKSPWELDKKYIKKMQQKLIREDMLLPGIPIDDKDNLLNQAEIEVSSVEDSGMQRIENRIQLKINDYIVIPSGAGEVQFLFHTERETELGYDCYAFDLPSKLALEGKLMEGKLPVNPGKHWAVIPLPKTRKPQFFVLVITQVDNIELITGKRQLTGFLGGNSSDAKVWYPSVQFSNSLLYSGENLTNAFNRPWKNPNIWISKEEESPYIILHWKQEVTVRQLDIILNPDLSLELNTSRASSWSDHHMFEPRLAMPPQLVKELAVYRWDVESYVPVTQVKDNWKRRVNIIFAQPVVTSKIKIQITSTYGAAHGEVFEVRVY